MSVWQAEPVDTPELERVLRATCDEVEGEGNSWRFEFEGVQMVCMTDSYYDRMRIVAPVTEVSSLDEGHHYAMLEANYHSALDVRYAIADGVVMVAFIHPFSPLSEEDAGSAIRQVASAVATFGDTYSSGALVFGPAGRSALN